MHDSFSFFPPSYCRVLLDPHGRVMSITYIGREPVEVNNLAHLVNMHEAALSSLEHFYEKGSVEDLISFFRQVIATRLQ